MDFLETETFGTGKDIRDHPLQPLRFMVEDTEPRKRQLTDFGQVSYREAEPESEARSPDVLLGARSPDSYSKDLSITHTVTLYSLRLSWAAHTDQAAL